MSFKVGDYICLSHYAEVKSVDAKGNLHVQDLETGLPIDITGKKLLDCVLSAQNFGSTEEVTRTQLAEKLAHSNGKPFQVKFKKVDGKLRTLVGRLLSLDSLMGRAYVHDFEEGNSSKGLRQVDFRTLEELIVDNVKYKVK